MKSRIGIIGVCAVLLSLAGCGEQEVVKSEEARPVKVMTLTSQEPFGGRWFPGKATATQEANLSFRVAGTVNRIPVDVGDEVNKGDLLARLDPQDYRVALNDAKAQLRKAKADLDLAESEYERVARVFEKDPGAVSKSMVDVRKAQLDTASAQVVSAQAAVESATDNLSYTSLKSPYDGVVVQKFVEQFEDVQAKQEIIRVLDTRRIEFTVQVPEMMMDQVDLVKQIGAYVVFDAFLQLEVPARIKEVGKEASKTTRTYPVTLVMDQPEEIRILPGMAGKARASKEASAQLAKEKGMVGFQIPVAATFADDAGQSYVWVVDPQSSTVSKRPVDLISITERGATISGVEANEMIATAGVNFLVEGQKVRVLE
ncbi:MAG: efflux RND transporter periplasmic adaptor subunit [Deltaproteobacteria bacterium]|jgi:RND family efflux transporter MFP subunit|nr:efflux RND transporter periplasmic adaptor subunit [Deltaproteobacteria bacterium]MBW2519007.1 efflux RND transporter periplasmic adaptor subunit [Deltaproteobacteria bacterium]